MIDDVERSHTCQLLATHRAWRDSSAAIGSRTRLHADVRPRHRAGITRPPLRRAVPATAAVFVGPGGVDSRTDDFIPLPVWVGCDVIVDRSQVWSSLSTRLYRAADEQTEQGRQRARPLSDELPCWTDIDDTDGGGGGGGGGGTGTGNVCADDECVKFWRHPLLDIWKIFQRKYRPLERILSQLPFCC